MKRWNIRTTTGLFRRQKSSRRIQRRQPLQQIPEDETWAVYWYLCGSDLESYAGCATRDMAEMLDVALPDEVQVVIQTGGAAGWNNFEIDDDSIGRYLYDTKASLWWTGSPSPIWAIRRRPRRTF